MAHKEFRRIVLEDIKIKNKDCILIDMKEFFNSKKAKDLGLTYWGYNKLRYLVTGGAGFIGSNIVG